MAHRQLLTDQERRALIGIPLDADSMARCFTLSRADQELVAARRRDSNRIGFAVQLALFRYPGIALAQVEQPIEPLVQWLARQLEIAATPFAGYARRPQTMTDHAWLLATMLGLRPSANTDLHMMIDAAAQAAWSTERGQPLATAVVAALRASGIILPPSGVIERAAIAGRARARTQATDALLAGVSDEQIGRQDKLLAIDLSVNMTLFAWLKAMPVAKADHVRELLDRLRQVRSVGLESDIAGRIHEERLRQFVREGYGSDAHQLGRYAARRRRAILIATLLDLEVRLTDAVLEMADKLIGGLFAKARNARRRRYEARTGDVGRLMRLFHGTIGALAAAQADVK
jgi:voltage-gated potassium channel Kch